MQLLRPTAVAGSILFIVSSYAWLFSSSAFWRANDDPELALLVALALGGIWAVVFSLFGLILAPLERRRRLAAESVPVPAPATAAPAAGPSAAWRRIGAGRGEAILALPAPERAGGNRPSPFPGPAWAGRGRAAAALALAAARATASRRGMKGLVRGARFYQGEIVLRALSLYGR